VETAYHLTTRVQRPIVGSLGLSCDVLTMPDGDQHLVVLTAEPHRAYEQAPRVGALIDIQSLASPPAVNTGDVTLGIDDVRRARVTKPLVRLTR
jgi:hypothetical protein